MNAPNTGLQMAVDTEALRPLIRVVVDEALAALEQARGQLGSKLAFSEAEAAALISLHPHQLRDERRRGRIQASSIVGKRVRYTRDDLLAYLMANRTNTATA
jgi:hypothetical protein